MKAQATQSGPIGNDWLPTTKTNLSGAGSTQGTATVIPSGQDLSIFTTVASSTGAVLPLFGVTLGEEYMVANHGANALSVYPTLGGFMGTAAQNAAYSLAAGKTGYFVYVGTNHWTVNP